MTDILCVVSLDGRLGQAGNIKLQDLLPGPL